MTPLTFCSNNANTRPFVRSPSINTAWYARYTCALPRFSRVHPGQRLLTEERLYASSFLVSCMEASGGQVEDVLHNGVALLYLIFTNSLGTLQRLYMSTVIYYTLAPVRRNE